MKRWWGRLEKRRRWRLSPAGTRRDGDETEDETGGPGDETAAMAGDEMVATGGEMYTDEAELEFDENEIAALEGQLLVAEFGCGIVSRFRVCAELRRLPCE